MEQAEREVSGGMASTARSGKTGTKAGTDAQVQEKKKVNFKNTPKSTGETTVEIENTTQQMEEEEHDDVKRRDNESELHHQLFDSLRECSRQRLRALRMSLRRTGSSEARLSSKELTQVFQENGLKVHGRALQLITDSYEDARGIDYERMWRSFVDAQIKTGRDSVLAQNKRNDLEKQQVMTAEQRDADLQRRLVEQLDISKVKYDLPKIRTTLQNKDKNKTGKLKHLEMLTQLGESSLPVYGALLTGLLRRCDEDRAGDVSWPMVMSFLENADQIANGESVKPFNPKLQIPQAESKPGPTALSPTPRADAKPSPSGTVTPRAGTRPRNKPTPGSATSRVSRPGTRQGSAKPIAASGRTPTSGSKDGGDRDVAILTPDIARSATPAGDHVKSEGKETSAAAQSPRPSPKSLDQTASTSEDTTGKSKTERIPHPTAKQMIRSAFNKAERDDVTESTKTGDKENAGKKDSKDAIPIIQVDKNTTSEPTAPGKPKSAKDLIRGASRAASPQTLVAGGRLEAEVRGKKVIYHPPDSFSESQVSAEPPKERLKLEWVYGYRGNDCRSNIQVLSSGEVLYFVGTVVVLYHSDRHQQRHYREHTAPVRSVALHSNGVTVASGQDLCPTGGAATKVHVRVWRADTLETLRQVGGDWLQKSVLCLNFGKPQLPMATDISGSSGAADGAQQNSTSHLDWLFAVDGSAGHGLSVWDINTGKVVAKTQLDLEMVCDINTSPVSPDEVVVVGKEHIGWWQAHTDSQTVRLQRTAEFQTYLRAKYVISALHTDRGDLVTGDSNGTVYVWGRGGTSITNLVKHAHDGPVFSLLMTRATLLTAGRDGAVHGWHWGKNMEHAGTVQVPRSEGGVRMIQQHREHLLLGTTTNSMLTVKLAGHALRNPLSGANVDPIALTQGHFDTLRCVSAPKDPDQPSLVLTAGHDGGVCLFDTAEKRPMWKIFLKNVHALCCDVNTEDSLLTIGTKDSILLYAMETDEEGLVCFGDVYRGRGVTKERLAVIKLAPDCQSLAAADVGGTVYVVGAAPDDAGHDTWQVVIQWQAHSAVVTGLDWSLDGYEDSFLLRTSAANHTYSIWNSDSGVEVRRLQDVRNIRWYTHSCLLAHGTAGIWCSKQAAEGTIQTVDVNPAQSLTVVGDNKGILSLFRYPCSKKSVFSHTCLAHPEVLVAQFTQTGSRVVTCGGADYAIMQWIVE